MGDVNHEAPLTPELKDLNWNTQRVLREKFGFPTDDEFFAVWLFWFYDCLNAEQRRILRKVDLDTINVEDYPKPPAPTTYQEP